MTKLFGDDLNVAWLALRDDVLAHFDDDELLLSEWLHSANPWIGNRTPLLVIQGEGNVDAARLAFSHVDDIVEPHEDDPAQEGLHPLQ